MSQLTFDTEKINAKFPWYPSLFSPCRQYRYVLWRVWDEALPSCQFIGLNPSTADDENDDPTIRRCIDFAKRFSCGSLCMTNLFAWRETDPKKMKQRSEPIGPLNDHALVGIASFCKLTIAAWGKDGKHLKRAAAVKKLPMILQYLRLNKDGSPQHPLYLPAILTPVEFGEPI